MIIDQNFEAELISKSKLGESSSFELLFNNYKESIKMFLVQLSNNEFDSNDLLQETFMKAFLKISYYKESIPFGLWLRVIARNTFIDYARRRSVKNSVLSFDVDLYGDNSIGQDDEDCFCIEQMFDKMEDYMSELPENYRQALELKYYHGMNYEQISQQMNIPLGTVKTWLFRAKEILRARIQKED